MTLALTAAGVIVVGSAVIVVALAALLRAGMRTWREVVEAPTAQLSRMHQKTLRELERQARREASAGGDGFPSKVLDVIERHFAAVGDVLDEQAERLTGARSTSEDRSEP